MAADVPDSKTYVHALAALAMDGVVRGSLSMTRTEAFVLWWMALGAGILGVVGAGVISLHRELKRLSPLRLPNVRKGQ